MHLSLSAWHHPSKLPYCGEASVAKRHQGNAVKAAVSHSAKHVPFNHPGRKLHTTARRSAQYASASTMDHGENTFKGPAVLARLLACTVYAMPVFEGATRQEITFLAPFVRNMRRANLDMS